MNSADLRMNSADLQINSADPTQLAHLDLDGNNLVSRTQPYKFLLFPVDRELLDPYEDFLHADNTFVRRPHGGRQLSWYCHGRCPH